MITLLSTGSRGDTQPYLALGKALKKAGFDVRVAAFENYETFVKSHDLEFYPIQGDVSKVASSLGSQKAMQADNPLKFLLSFNKLKKLIFDLQNDFYEACIGSEAILYHPGAAIGYFAAQQLGIPSILATPFPMTPTREYPSLIFYDSIRLGKGFNYATHKIFEQVMWFATNSPIKQFWQKKFGKLPVHFGSPFSKQNTQKLPTIVSCSNYVFERPKDWPEHVHNTGYWFLETEGDWEPPKDLVDFLQDGKPPVYVGFGSVANTKLAVQTTNLVLQALKRSGQRGVLATGWNGMSRSEQAPEGIFFLESAPHDWLFPQMAAVIHHGGAGTTAAGLRAGIPSIVIPHSNDQFAWGRRIYELGAGTKPIPRKKLTAETLAAAIEHAMADDIKIAAQKLGKNIQSEHGAETAAQIIMNCLKT